MMEIEYEKSLLFAEIIIPLFLPQNYIWSVPHEWKEKIVPGIRVEVSLKNKKYTGIVKRLFHEKPEGFTPKSILNIIDAEPLVYPQQLQLWQWISHYYLCTEGDVMQAALPANFKLSSESVLIWNDEFPEEDITELDEDEYIIAEALTIKKELRLSEVQQLLDSAHVYPTIQKLIDKKICFVWEELKQKYKEKKETFVLLKPQYNNDEALEKLLNEWSGAPKQMELLLAYLHLKQTQGEVERAALLKKSEASSAQLNALVKKNILHLEKRAVDRLPLLQPQMNIDFQLSLAQQNALDEIQKSFAEKNVSLLHGVTSSGKTQIYIKLLEEVLSTGKQALYMLPEIALTSQIIRRLQKHFGGNIAIYHSKFNPNERVEIWNKIKSGEVKILLGARSSLFLPFKDLGLIIVDEEHETSYKQYEPAPRYHARDAAIFYATLFDAKVLLGSATPSVETYHNCQTDKYGLIELNERYGNVEMPDISVVDLKSIPEPKEKEEEKSLFSASLKTAIEKSLSEKKQVILFQNRRGYTPYFICNTCGWIPHCTDCDVTLTYHKSKNKLSCHYCGKEYPLVQTCMACGSHDFKQKNFGTEKVEEIVLETFQETQIARMDYDTVRGKNDHDALIKKFEQKHIDILIGTQMVVKGLDFEHVNLVGILDADGILNFTDFRVNERAFQLLEQVSGRAGRREQKGLVIIQVSKINHPVLHFVAQHNYKAFFDFEIENRKLYEYPPFSRLIKISIKHKYKNIAEEASNILVNGMRGKGHFSVIGPAEPVIARIRNQYIFEVLIKLPKDAKQINFCKKLILQQIVLIQNNKRYRSVVILPDVDPL